MSEEQDPPPKHPGGEAKAALERLEERLGAPERQHPLGDEENTERPFKQRAVFDRDELVGARWWQEGLAATAAEPSRREALYRILALAGGAVAIGSLVSLCTGSDDGRGAEDKLREDSRDALELQSSHGWDVGHAGEALDFRGATALDADGNADWAAQLSTLVQELGPAGTALRPFYVPTLFQSLTAVGSDSLRAAMRPIHTAEMDAAHGQGEALAVLFGAVGQPADTAVLVDVPGEQAVAFTAGLAERFDPVFLLDNWPHPRGVVPSQLVLAAAIYYRPELVRRKQGRSSPTPPVFVLDSRRLTPYTDSGDRFDNRYLARMPSAESLQGLGVRHVLYVTPGAEQRQELDDLNDDFVAYAQAGIDVKLLALTDFAAAQAAAGASDGGVAALGNPMNPMNPVTSTTSPAPRYSYGGHPLGYVWFWRSYGWYAPPAPRGPVGEPPPRVSSGASFRPVPRPTLFSVRTLGGTTGIGRQKPAGFGRVSVQVSESGHVVGTGRSGSFGRSRSSWSG